ncbi:GNAT family N-acetyltransferase [Deinococcus arenicola]|uniref:GNAT family N-acetyltransferase n=1 Tax=Deinococcus arenicola TaxID=2994950 RepID=A0ABU4DP35_9DEIO|nr:GNAT family N-acetyltransferase [Deinococcus sp. ZS9-10]MDV6373459.1 GNAT family N-acetyltransferase [Deinococcus sp. ZS9-10]
MTDHSAGKITLKDNEAAQQYELYVDGQLAGHAEYRPLPDARELPHTEIDGQYEGQGLGSKLVQFALDDLRGRGLNAVPTCPFVADYISKHPEYQDLVQG